MGKVNHPIRDIASIKACVLRKDQDVYCVFVSIKKWENSRLLKKVKGRKFRGFL